MPTSLCSAPPLPPPTDILFTSSTAPSFLPNMKHSIAVQNNDKPNASQMHIWSRCSPSKDSPNSPRPTSRPIPAGDPMLTSSRPPPLEPRLSRLVITTLSFVTSRPTELIVGPLTDVHLFFDLSIVSSTRVRFASTLSLLLPATPHHTTSSPLPPFTPPTPPSFAYPTPTRTHVQKNIPPHLSPVRVAALATQLDPDFHRSADMVTVIPPSTRNSTLGRAATHYRPRRRARPSFPLAPRKQSHRRRHCPLDAALPAAD
ncbi:hypothetical protein R3P38DRAFT_3176110 [Favolaschia claudopus]|uniref:Uncharacterized protein n=1 Tax=Favolaschia claudopus TaxID=2862362 RepID=A0AAW0D8R5_9AGAR